MAQSKRKIAASGKVVPRFRGFDAGKQQRRLRSMPTSAAAINAQIRAYGKTIVTRSRYLAANNPYAAAAKETFVSALVGCGITPSPLIADQDTKQALQKAFAFWTDESDADQLTDFYGLQRTIAREMFEAGECFIRLRPRRAGDGLSVPLQLQLLPAEMLPLDLNQDLGKGQRIECGIQFDAIGQRVAYHFLRQHPGSEFTLVTANLGQPYSVVPAEEVLHLYDPLRAGQIRGIPHTISGIVKLAIMDQYDDAELERKRTGALFVGAVSRPTAEDGSHPLGDADALTKDDGTTQQSYGLEPGVILDLQPGEAINFSDPPEVGTTYEMFQYRSLTAIAAGFGVPYAAMTGDLRQTSYGSIRAGLVEFRRRIESMQHGVMVFQFCRPIWKRWLTDAVLASAVPVTPAQLKKAPADYLAVKWQPPKWDWIDPLKDLEAEKLAVDNGFKARSDVQEANGNDPDETDARIAADQQRAEKLGLKLNINNSAPADTASASGNAGDNPPDQSTQPGANTDVR